MKLNNRDEEAMQSSVSLTIPKIPTHKACGDYLVSKSLNKRNKVTIQDDINRNVTIEHHFAFKKLLDAEHRLKARKELAAKQRQELNDQWMDLGKKEDHLRENFIFFDKFVHENTEKRERAQVKLSSMKKLYRTRVQQILETETECQSMKDAKMCLDHNITRMHIYETFLAQVVERFPRQFTGITDVLNRYESLMHAQKELIGVQEIAMKQLERAKSNFDKLVAEKYIEIACLKTKLSDIERCYETAHSNCQKWENVHHVVTLETQSKLIETEAVKNSCWQIYKDICDRKGVPTIHKDDYPKQFETIKKGMLQRKLVNEKIAALEEEKLRLSEKACASSETG